MQRTTRDRRSNDTQPISSEVAALPSEFSIARSGVRKAFFRRVKSCPFSGPKAQPIDYKNIRILRRFVSEQGKMLPSRITAVSAKKQRKLAQAIKRARFLALIPYCEQ